MSTRTERWPQGTPSWIDLLTPDMDKAKAFYGPLFGWEFEDQGAEFGHYQLVRLGGRDVAGAMQMVPEMGDMPPAWATYIAVDDMDRTLEAVTTAGGQVVVPVMDVGDQGRSMMVTDPTGAAIGFWQAKSMIGAAVTNEPGALRWNQLSTRDTAAARDFYAKVLGVTHEPIPDNPTDFTTINVAGRPVGGIGGMDASTPAEVPAHWEVFFEVADVDEAMAKVRELGGRVMTERMDTPYGRMAMVADDQGTAFFVNDSIGDTQQQG